MKNLAKFIFVAASASVALAAHAQEEIDKDVPIPVRPDSLYLQDKRDIVVRDNYGLCWETAYANGPCVEPPPPPPPIAVAEPTPAPEPQPVIKTETITYEAETLFDFDKYKLKPAGKLELDKLYSKLEDFYGKDKIYDLNGDITISVVGHTDLWGPAPYNQTLSENRANAVRDYLISKGIGAQYIHAEGKGMTQPLCNNKKINCNKKNRRVEINLHGTLKKTEMVVSPTEGS